MPRPFLPAVSRCRRHSRTASAAAFAQVAARCLRGVSRTCIMLPLRVAAGYRGGCRSGAGGPRGERHAEWRGQGADHPPSCWLSSSSGAIVVSRASGRHGSRARGLRGSEDNVREISVPALVTADPGANLTDLVDPRRGEAPDAVLFSRPPGGAGGWEDVTSAAFLAEVTRLSPRASWPPASEPGDRVALMSQDALRVDADRLRDLVRRRGDRADLRDLLGRAGPVDPVATPAPCAVVIETAAHAATVGQVRGDLPRSPRSGPSTPATSTTLAGAGAGRRRRGDRAPPRARCAATPWRPSSTPPAPPGGRRAASSPTRNFLASSPATRATSSPRSSAPTARRTLLFLPLAHVFARFVQVGCVAARGRIGHTADVKNLIADLGEFRPTFVLAVPASSRRSTTRRRRRPRRRARARSSPPPADTAIAYSEALDDGGPGLGAAGAARALRPARLRQAARPRSAAGSSTPVCGGAPLGAAARPLLPGHRRRRSSRATA